MEEGEEEELEEGEEEGGGGGRGDRVSKVRLTGQAWSDDVADTFASYVLR